MPANLFYFPFDEGPGSDSLENRWEAMMQFMRTTGVVIDWDQSTLNPSTDDLAVTANGGLSVQTAVGEAWIHGFMLQQQDDYYSIPISPNSSGDPRIDLLTARLDTDANTIVYHVEEGTPAMSPVAPTPVESDPIWDLSLAEIYVADGAVTILSGDITDLRVRSVQGDGGSSAVTLSSAGGDESLVAQPVGPNLEIQGLTAGPNISLTSDGDQVTISASPTPSDSIVCILTLSANQTVADSVADTITWDTAILDPDNLWNGTTNITIPESGLYAITVNVAWTGDVLSNGTVSAYAVEGITTLVSSMALAVGDVVVSNNANALVELSESDVISVTASNNSGVNLDVQSSADYFPYVSVIKVRS